jgi:hypothetical protein
MDALTHAILAKVGVLCAVTEPGFFNNGGTNI